MHFAALVALDRRPPGCMADRACAFFGRSEADGDDCVLHYVQCWCELFELAACRSPVSRTFGFVPVSSCTLVADALYIAHVAARHSSGCPRLAKAIARRLRQLACIGGMDASLASELLADQFTSVG